MKLFDNEVIKKVYNLLDKYSSWFKPDNIYGNTSEQQVFINRVGKLFIKKYGRYFIIYDWKSGCKRYIYLSSIAPKMTYAEQTFGVSYLQYNDVSFVHNKEIVNTYIRDLEGVVATKEEVDNFYKSVHLEDLPILTYRIEYYKPNKTKKQYFDIKAQSFQSAYKIFKEENPKCIYSGNYEITF